MCEVVDRKKKKPLRNSLIILTLEAVYSVIYILKCHFANTRITNLIYWVAEVAFSQLEGSKFNSIEICSEWDDLMCCVKSVKPFLLKISFGN